MDASVIAAIARWPDVPHVYGWLSLDRRGRWCVQGSPVANPNIADFIGRNYERDERGAWFFQNGPQRVYVRLDYTPWIVRLGDGNALVTHTGLPMQMLTTALLDEHGNLLLGSEHGIGLVDDRDLARLLDAVRDHAGRAVDENILGRVMSGELLPLQFRWARTRLPLLPVRSGSIPERFSFVADPQPD